MPEEIAEAVERGLACACALHDRGLIDAAAIRLQGETRIAIDGVALPRLSHVATAASLQQEIAHA
jgi:translation initiation factor 1 (eIF-1/SUI1)